MHCTSLYAVLDFDTDSALLCNLVSIQQSGKMPGDVVIYAHVTQDPTDSFFLAYIHSLTLFGLLNFIDIEFQYKYSPESTIHLTGDISVPAIAPDSKFHGSLQIVVKTADFSLTGSKQPEVLHEPLGMFGIQILSPVLRLHYDFEPFSYNYELSGSVEFYSHPDENSSDSNASTEPKKPSATLTAKCIFIEDTPKVVDIASESPLTAADFVATVFNANWDMTFLNIGFYSGRLYYANIDNHKALHSPSDTFQYKSGYFMACKTFIFTDDFQFDIEMSIPLDFPYLAASQKLSTVAYSKYQLEIWTLMGIFLMQGHRYLTPIAHMIDLNFLLRLV